MFSHCRAWLCLALSAWMTVLVLLPSSARAEDELLDEQVKPSLAFLGVDDVDSDEAGQHHELEVGLIKLLISSGEWDLRTPEVLDRELGRSNRILILSSRVPGKAVPEFAKSIGANHTLLAQAPKKNGDGVTTLLLLNTAYGTTEGTETVREGESFVSALQRLRQRVKAIEEGQPARAAAPQNARIIHTPVTTGLENVPLVIEASVSCPAKCDAVVYYRLRPDKDWLPATLLPSKDKKISRAALAPMMAGTAEYFINVTDGDLNRIGMDGSDSAPHVVQLLTAAPPAPAQPPIIPLTAVAAHETPKNRVFFRTGVGLAILSGAALITGGVLLGLNHHESSVIHDGSLATGADISHAMQLSSSYNAAGWTCISVGAISGVAGTAFLLLRERP